MTYNPLLFQEHFGKSTLVNSPWMIYYSTSYLSSVALFDDQLWRFMIVADVWCYNSLSVVPNHWLAVFVFILTTKTHTWHITPVDLEVIIIDDLHVSLQYVLEILIASQYIILDWCCEIMESRRYLDCEKLNHMGNVFTLI